MEINSQQHRDALYNMLEDAYGKVVYTYKSDTSIDTKVSIEVSSFYR